MRHTAIAVLLALSLPGTAAAAQATGDKYLWLEDVSAEQSLAWARARNAETTKVLAGTDAFRALDARLLAILDSDARIPLVEKLGPSYYNFWRDAKNPRGLWRRTSLDEYRKEHPQWEVVIDLDALAAAEKENWVWHGADCLKPEYERCLVQLSRGGADADVVREFDLAVEDLGQGWLLPARGEEQRGLVRPRHAVRRYRLRPGLDDHFRLPARRQGVEAGDAARLGGDGVRGPARRRVGRRDARPHEGVRARLRPPRRHVLLERDVPAPRRQAREDRQARQRERERAPRPPPPRAARRLDGGREDLPCRRPPRRRLRGLPRGRAALRRPLPADRAQVARRVQPDARTTCCSTSSTTSATASTCSTARTASGRASRCRACRSSAR